jgi:voltage-gated potassium channel Kch
MATTRSELKSTGYEIFIGVLSVLSITNIVLVAVYVDDEALRVVLSAMNVLFSAIFLGDFAYRLFTAPSRSAYFFRHFGWADLLASLPFPQFKILRVFRLIRVIRLLRALGPRTIARTLIRDRAGSALFVLLLMGIFVLQFGSLFMLYLEKDAPEANITSGPDALWYTMVTIATVGYGDRFPVTSAGRVMGSVIIVIGVGIFGAFTGYLANLFLAPRPEDAEPEVVAVVAEAPSVATLEELRTKLAQSEASLAEMRELLDRHVEAK